MVRLKPDLDHQIVKMITRPFYYLIIKSRYCIHEQCAAIIENYTYDAG